MVVKWTVNHRRGVGRSLNKDQETWARVWWGVREDSGVSVSVVGCA